MRIYSQPPIILGGRQPIKADQQPHLAEVFPQIIAPRQMVIDQIRFAIRSKKNIAILGLPGVGKSRLIAELIKEFNVPKSNYIEGSTRDLLGPQLVALSGIIILDDVRFYVPPETAEFCEFDLPKNIIGPEIGESIVKLAVSQGKQLIFIEPPVEESFLAKHVENIFILPAPDFHDFDTVLSSEIVNHRPLSLTSRQLIYDLSGGNFRLALTIIQVLQGIRTEIVDKVLKSLTLFQPEITLLCQEIETINNKCLRTIRSNFCDDFGAHELIKFVFLPNGGRIKTDRFWTHFNLEQQEAIIRMLQYGLLMIDKDEIKFRSSLIQQSFADYFDPAKRQSPFIVL